MGAIARVFDVTEPAFPKPGHGGLKLLEALGGSAREPERYVGGSTSEAERYFDVAEPASPKPGHGSLKLLFGESQYQYFYKHNNCMQVTASDNLH